MTTPRDRALLLLGVLASSTAAVLVRGAGDAPPLVIAGYRLAIGCAIVATPMAITRARGGASPITGRTRSLVLVTIMAGLLLAAHFATWFASLQRTSVASSLTLVSSHPIFVAMFGRMLLGERVTGRTWIGIGVGAGAMVALAMLDLAGGSHRSLQGDALALTGAIAVAGYALCGRWARNRVALLPYVTATYGVAALTVSGIALGSGDAFTGYSSGFFLCVALLGFVPQGMGHSLINRSLRVYPAATVSLVLLAEIPLGTLFAFLAFHESVPLPRALAVSVIVAAVAMVLVNPGARTKRVIGSTSARTR